MKMKNKIELKKSIIISIFVILIWSSIFALFNLYQYSVYTNNFNNKIDQIVTKIATEYPDIQKSCLLYTSVKNLTVTTLKKKFIEMMNIFIIYLVRKVSI